MRKVILGKSWTNIFGRKYPIGQTILCNKILEKVLIDGGYAKDFEAKTSKGKVKTDFFKPKD
jgi:hypothetical protein